jgi:hypothetical protein
VTTSADCRLVEDHRNRNDKRHAHLFISAAFLLVDLFSATTIANAQSSAVLPAVTVESPTQRQKLARPAGPSAPRTRAAAARQRNQNATPTQPTLSERAVAAAATQ